MELDFDVVDLGPADHPEEEGDQAPDFTRPLVTDEYGRTSPSPTSSSARTAPRSWSSTRWTAPSRDVRLEGDHEARVARGRHRGRPIHLHAPTPIRTLIEERGLGEDYVLYSDPAATVAEEYDIAHELDGMAGVVEPGRRSSCSTTT